MAEDITVQDINAAIQIIDVCSTRGAFKGEELAEVGTLRNKFAAVLKSASEPAEAPDEDLAVED
ncbi:MAG: hypothetical protein WCY93_07350 [Anaerolineaceae bacterium]